MDACTWDDFSGNCDISLEVSSALLAKADNPVAKYLFRIFECYQYVTHDSCESNGCQWYDQMCSYTFDDYKNLVASPCLDKANQIVDSVAWSIQCSDLEDDFTCNVHDHCFWSDNECVFDRWTYYFNIQTVDSFPEGFDELFDLRSDQLAEYFTELYDESNREETANEILYATLPDFQCPYGYEALVCRYVEAISQVQQVSYYCAAKYSTVSGCSSDEYCKVIYEQGLEVCAADDSQIVLSVLEGEKVFNSAIEDPEARKLEDKRLHCMMQDSLYSCTGDCKWSYNDVCLLSGQWIEEYIYSLIGDSDDPVCQYFVLPTTTGCIDRDSEFQCAFDEKCYWSAANEYCIAGLTYSVEMALDISDLGCEFRDIYEACQASDTRRECRRVPDYDGVSHGKHGMSGSHSGEDVRFAVQSNEAHESTPAASKRSSNRLWLLLIPIGLVLSGIALAYRRKKLQNADGWKTTPYQVLDNAETH